MVNSGNGLAILVECQDCGKKFEVSSKDKIVQHKKEFKVNEQSIFITYYDCPDCGRRHCVQIDTEETLLELQKVEGQLTRLFSKRGKSTPQKQSESFKEARKHLADSRNRLMKRYTGKLIHDSETDTDIELKFSV